MRRSLGFTWFAAAIASAAAIAAAAGAFLLDAGPQLGLAAMMLGIIGSVLGLLATPLALAPAEALRASLASREPGAARWGEERKDLWGALARDIAAGTRREALDPSIDIRRLAANLELTLRQMSEECETVRARMGEAAVTLEGAAASGARLSGVAEEATRQLAAAVQRTDDATGALAVLPALAVEQASSIEKAAVRSLAAAEALEAAATRPYTPPEPASPEPRAEDIALREAAMHGAEQARRLVEAMPLLIEAVARLPAAAASQEALSEAARRLTLGADRMEAGLDRLEAIPDPMPEAPAPAPSAPDAPDPSSFLQPILDTIAQGQEAAVRAAADAVAGRVADIAEVMVLQAAWRAGDAAEQAALRLEAAAGAAVASSVAASAAASGETLSEALARIADPLGQQQAALGAISERLEAAVATIEASDTDERLRVVAGDIVDRAEGLLVRLESLGVAPATQPVSGKAGLDAVADRVTTDLAVIAPAGEQAALPQTLLSLDETIRRLNELPGESQPER